VNDKEETVPGLAALRAWLEDKKLSKHRFALDIGQDPSEFGKLLKKDAARVSVELAFKIERATEGAVTVDMFVPVRRAT
jgi:hypothetical protein